VDAGGQGGVDGIELICRLLGMGGVRLEVVCDSRIVYVDTSIFRMWFPPAIFENQFFFSTSNCKYHLFLNTNAIFLHKIDLK
jgi:hypothetical protein